MLAKVLTSSFHSAAMQLVGRAQQGMVCQPLFLGKTAHNGMLKMPV